MKTVWPSVELLLCVFHILQAVWKWLKGRPRLDRDTRLHLLRTFSDVLFFHSNAADEEGMFVDLKARAEAFVDDEVVKAHPEFITYLKRHYALALDDDDKAKAKRIYTCFRALLASPDRSVHLHPPASAACLSHARHARPARCTGTCPQADVVSCFRVDAVCARAYGYVSVYPSRGGEYCGRRARFRQGRLRWPEAVVVSCLRVGLGCARALGYVRLRLEG